MPHAALCMAPRMVGSWASIGGRVSNFLPGRPGDSAAPRRSRGPGYTGTEKSPCLAICGGQPAACCYAIIQCAIDPARGHTVWNRHAESASNDWPARADGRRIGTTDLKIGYLVEATYTPPHTPLRTQLHPGEVQGAWSARA